MTPEHYNYANFELDDEEMGAFEAFPSILRVGDRAPDAPLVDANTGAEIALSSLWKRDNLVMEFGSFT